MLIGKSRCSASEVTWQSRARFSRDSRMLEMPWNGQVHRMAVHGRRRRMLPSKVLG